MVRHYDSYNMSMKLGTLSYVYHCFLLLSCVSDVGGPCGAITLSWLCVSMWKESLTRDSIKITQTTLISLLQWAIYMEIKSTTSRLIVISSGPLVIKLLLFYVNIIQYFIRASNSNMIFTYFVIRLFECSFAIYSVPFRRWVIYA